MADTPSTPGRLRQLAAIFWLFLSLGCTSFGGPVAHIAYFRQAFVRQRGWLSEQQFADLLALCQFMPGPASSQLGLAMGWLRGGYAGALVAWLGFTLPSALLLIAFALGLQHWQGVALDGAIHGLKITAVAVVVQAVWQMARQFCRRLPAVLLMAAAALAVLLLPGFAVQIGVLLTAALLGIWLLPAAAVPQQDSLPAVSNKKTAVLWLALFLLLLLGLPWMATAQPAGLLALADAFYCTGALVFGGGHVVLPVLQTQTVPLWLDENLFLAGYGAAQAVPGPLFTLAAFVGAAAQPEQPWLWGLTALAAIFLPSFLMVFGLLPFWSSLARYPRARAMLNGINAAVVGILLAALYHPVWTSSIRDATDVLWAGLVLMVLLWGRLPVWLLVLLSAVAGMLYYRN